jgi:hypothetical protein
MGRQQKVFIAFSAVVLFREQCRLWLSCLLSSAA